ncbi:MAG: hypothetical protein CMG57_02385 [Candidatus Marinimicrobia bacterium]|nr:hypothetical protein [Candidatus Neomarinimicrobiota bacterium]
MLKRIIKVYYIIGKTFGVWIAPIFTGLIIIILRIVVEISRFVDHLLFSAIRKSITAPIIIVGNPRSGTTFLHRFLIKQGFGVGSQLWQMVYPSIFLQKILKPFLPIMEFFSPARHHSTEAHKTSLSSIETDDVSLFFRYFDGFFLYGFFLTFDEEDLFNWIDPKVQDTTIRDFAWFEALWQRNLISNKGKRYIGKLFSLSGNLPKFQKTFPDAKVIYMVRDPLSVIPSGLSLVTGVLDKKFNFWSLDPEIKVRFIQRLYKALVELLNRFHEDWIENKIDKEKVLIVRFDNMMSNFESVMDDIISFTNQEITDLLLEKIKTTSESQRAYKSGHKYDLQKFGLSEDQIKKDCIHIYETFLF